MWGVISFKRHFFECEEGKEKRERDEVFAPAHSLVRSEVGCGYHQI